MMRSLCAAMLLWAAGACGQEATLLVHAEAFRGRPIILYRYDDLFSLRTSRIGAALIGDDGRASLHAAATGTERWRLRIGEVYGDLYARADCRYELRFDPPDARTATSLNGSTRTELVLLDLSPLDPNALTADLNARIDAFILEDLATDQVAGMQAATVVRKSAPADSTRRPNTLFVTPQLSRQRVDSFALRLKRFYGEVNDPWFAHYLENSLASMRFGPRVNEQELYELAIKGRPVAYDDPEYVRFLRSFYSEQPLSAQRFAADALRRAFASGDADSLKAVFARNDFLRDDDRRCELVMMDLLHQQYHQPWVVKPAADRMLAQLAGRSAYPEHRAIAANMLWDLTAMRVGSALPSMRLEDLRGRTVAQDSLLGGATCIMVTASWCTYCDLEVQALEALQRDYKDVVRFILIGLDQDGDALRRYAKAYPALAGSWLHAQAEQELRDDLRIRSIPAVFLLNDGILARSPAPLPSKGLGALLQRVKADAQAGGKLKVWDD
jgi:thiol-disulfide isomerase/thioredoxin